MLRIFDKRKVLALVLALPTLAVCAAGLSLTENAGDCQARRERRQGPVRETEPRRTPTPTPTPTPPPRRKP